MEEGKTKDAAVAAQQQQQAQEQEEGERVWEYRLTVSLHWQTVVVHGSASSPLPSACSPEMHAASKPCPGMSTSDAGPPLKTAYKHIAACFSWSTSRPGRSAIMSSTGLAAALGMMLLDPDHEEDSSCMWHACSRGSIATARKPSQCEMAMPSSRTIPRILRG